MAEKRGLTAGGVVLSLLIHAGTLRAQPTSFHGLGFVINGAPTSSAHALSAGGGYIAGWCDTSAVRWSASGELVALSHLDPPYNASAVAYGISADGDTVVGYGSAGLGGPFRAFVWHSATGTVALGQPPESGSIIGSYASGVSIDGRTIVGASDDETGISRAYMVNDQRPWGPIIDELSAASGVSADGRVVVGVAQVEEQDIAFSWTEEGGLRTLGDLPGGETSGIAYAANVDGSVIVGGSSSANSDPSFLYEAFRWTADTGMVGLGDLPGGYFSSEARAVSADGSVIVGRGSRTTTPLTSAFIWTVDSGMQDLAEILTTQHGLDLSGWTLLDAYAISADGRTIVGRGINPAGNIEAWIAHLGTTTCDADWNADGQVTSVDLIAFLDDFLCDSPSCPPADFNGDGVENSADVFDFLARFFGGCSG